MIRKGSVLDADAVAALRAAGRESVIAARLEPGDVDENASAARLAAALETRRDRRRGGPAPGGSTCTPRRPACCGSRRARIDAINGVRRGADRRDPAGLRGGRRAGHGRDDQGDPVRGPGRGARRGSRRRRERGRRSRCIRSARCGSGWCVSELPGLKESVIDGTIAATAARVRGARRHAAAAAALPARRGADRARRSGSCSQAGAELLLVAGASATVDRRDVGPAGVVARGRRDRAFRHAGRSRQPDLRRPDRRRAGARAARLRALAEAERHRLGAGSGCSRACRSGRPEIMRMGVGGLLKDTDAPAAAAREGDRAAGGRPCPRRRRSPPSCSRPGSRRAWRRTTSCWSPTAAGRAMVARVVDNVLSSGARPVIVVDRPSRRRGAGGAGGRPVHIRGCARPCRRGLSASLQRGHRRRAGGACRRRWSAWATCRS